MEPFRTRAGLIRAMTSLPPRGLSDLIILPKLTGILSFTQGIVGLRASKWMMAWF